MSRLKTWLKNRANNEGLIAKNKYIFAIMQQINGVLVLLTICTQPTSS